jgi:hypothetical protein
VARNRRPSCLYQQAQEDRHGPEPDQPCTAAEARLRYGDIPWLEDELVVVGDAGEVWAGPAAFLVCLWALVDWREWSFRLAGPAFAPLAERFFLFLSSKHKSVAALFDHDCADGRCRIGGRK